MDDQRSFATVSSNPSKDFLLALFGLEGLSGFSFFFIGLFHFSLHLMLFVTLYYSSNVSLVFRVQCPITLSPSSPKSLTYLMFCFLCLFLMLIPLPLDRNLSTITESFANDHTYLYFGTSSLKMYI